MDINFEHRLTAVEDRSKANQRRIDEIKKRQDDLEKLAKPLFPGIIADIAADPKLVEKVNIIAGDFMTADYSKAKEILSLNLLKGIVVSLLTFLLYKRIAKLLKHGIQKV